MIAEFTRSSEQSFARTLPVLSRSPSNAKVATTETLRIVT
jgi:hypothetical protein